MREPRQYAVEVCERYQHGRYGKRFYFGMYLCGFNKKDAEEVGIETVAAMTFEEINSRCVDDGAKPWEIWTQHEHERKHGKDAPIGFTLAESLFRFKAYIE